MGVTMASPPSVYKDVLITPGGTPVIRAWNARTGALLWTFNLIAQPGDPNNKTWENDSWKTIGGTNTWGYLSIDEERGIVYIPVSIAGGDYVGVERPGDNLYGTSLVAVDIATGKRRWHQQLVHHDIWDFDLGAAPTLFDAVKDGKRIPAVAQITKMGMLFMFDRVTGAPLFGIEERPVPQSTVPGEKTSPTQPFTIKPPPLARNSLKKSELPTTISPEHTAYCAALWDKYKLEDSVPYTPWKLKQDIVMFPGRDRRGQLERRFVQQEARSHHHQRDERRPVGTPRGSEARRRRPWRARWSGPGRPRRAASGSGRWKSASRRGCGTWRTRWSRGATGSGRRHKPPFALSKSDARGRTLLGTRPSVSL